MEEVCNRDNLNRAYKRVKANKGVPGVDGMRVDDLFEWIVENKHELIKSLLTGNYKPLPILGVEIPKPGNKGKRRLGIPSVVDRLIQQAIKQVLERYLDKSFSTSSFGFRPGRSAHQAIKRAQAFVKSGYTTVVDMDLCKFFDEVNHDILMSRLQSRFKDKRLLKLIGRFLRADMMLDNNIIKRCKGMPQGGPLSPLLSNLLLDDLDKELEKRGHKFCRYADDCNIYARSQRAGERVLESIGQYLTTHLKLQLNHNKSGVDKVWKRTFLGFTFDREGAINVSTDSFKIFKSKVKRITRRARGINLEQMITELNPVIRGWGNYFKIANILYRLKSLDGYIRRKLRCFRLRQIGKGYPLYRFLRRNGANGLLARNVGRSGKGWWCLSGTMAANQAMNNKWFRDRKLITFHQLLGR